MIARGAVLAAVALCVALGPTLRVRNTDSGGYRLYAVLQAPERVVALGYLAPGAERCFDLEPVVTIIRAVSVDPRFPTTQTFDTPEFQPTDRAGWQLDLDGHVGAGLSLDGAMPCR